MAYWCNSNFHLIRNKILLMNDFKLTVSDLYYTITTTTTEHLQGDLWEFWWKQHHYYNYYKINHHKIKTLRTLVRTEEEPPASLSRVNKETGDQDWYYTDDRDTDRQTDRQETGDIIISVVVVAADRLSLSGWTSWCQHRSPHRFISTSGCCYGFCCFYAFWR